MPDFEVTTPDGQKLTVTAPDGATEKDVYDQVQKYVSAPKQRAVTPVQNSAPSTPSFASKAWQAVNTPLFNPSTDVPESVTRGMSIPGRIALGGAQALGELGKS